ncbi:short-chain dehydrogenase/reductase SDR [Gymnopus androsaceus JB14]|uniref:Short-chain dehydrogenase/reductase SDR n=1 Tax=Gymnopus androsaceus JB14 TaxID=1447944 RepID=A0A6A4I4W3_9AGAR|nr:short-chain dehydrogenase/reductase SDR [Gymnopus androsaceus JB14]
MNIHRATAKPMVLIAGLGKGSGLGAASAQIFARSGYDVALVSRGEDTLSKLSSDLRRFGVKVEAFPTKSYHPADIRDTVASIRHSFPQPDSALRVAIWNVGYPIFKPFLSTTTDEVNQSLTVTEAAFAFSRECILQFQENEIEKDTGKKGTLVFTGATAATRGSSFTSAFSAAKSANRALSQSLAKEFGEEGIHVAHAILDGRIMSDDPETAAGLNPESIAKAYFNLAKQEKSAWTWELDLRPASGKW